MKKFPVLLLLLLTGVTSAQKWSYVQKIDGDRCENAAGISWTPENDLLITGIYEDPAGVRFESSDGIEYVIPPSQDTFPESHSTLYLAKYKKSGERIWTIKAYGENGITPWNLHCDNRGNSILCGNFRGMAIFFSTEGKTKTIYGTPPKVAREQPPLNYYVAKYDPDGKLLWVKVARSTDHSVAFEAGSDTAGNIYVRGYNTAGTITFNDFAILSKSGATFGGNLTLLLIKYDKDGNEQWITRGGNISVKEMDVAAEGKIILHAYQTDHAMVTTTSGKEYKFSKTDASGFNRILMHFNSDGELDKIANGFQGFQEAHIYRSIQDATGNYYALMEANPTESRGPKFKMRFRDKEFETKRYDIFLAKFNKEQQAIWITQFHGENDEKPLDIILDRNNNIILSGHFRQHIAVTDITGDSIVLNSDYQTMFIASFTPDGVIKWASSCGNLFKGFGEHLHLSVNDQNELAICGQINAPSTIGERQVDVKGVKGWISPGWDKKYDYNQYSDAFFGVINLENKNSNNNLIVNLSLNLEEAGKIISKSMELIMRELDQLHLYVQFEQNTRFDTPVKGNEVITYFPQQPEVTLYPNPVPEGQQVTAQFTLTNNAILKWTLMDQQGHVIFSKMENYPSGTSSFLFTVDGLAAGVYNLIMETGKFRVLKRIVVQ
jgi:hypothetical protein